MRAGRPPRAGKVAADTVRLRVTADERKAWEHAARDAKLTLSEWIRARCSTAPES